MEAGLSEMVGGWLDGVTVVGWLIMELVVDRMGAGW